MKYLDLDGLNTLKQYIKEKYAPIGSAGLSEAQQEILDYFENTQYIGLLEIDNTDGTLYYDESNNRVRLGNIYTSGLNVGQATQVYLNAATEENIGLLKADDFSKLDGFKQIKFNQLDDCGYGSAVELTKAAKNSKYGLKFYVTDTDCVLHVYGDNLAHGCTQVLTGSFITDGDGNISAGHTDGITLVATRHYINLPETFYNPSLGYDKTTQAWSAWVIDNVIPAIPESIAQNINKFKRRYGNLITANISTTDGKLKLDTTFTGGIGHTPGNAISTEIPEATQTSNGLMSATDKTRLDNLSASQSTTPIVARFIDTASGKSITDSTAVQPGEILWLTDKQTFVVHISGNYYTGDSAVLKAIAVKVPGSTITDKTKYKPYPNTLYIDGSFKMYVGDADTLTTDQDIAYSDNLNIINVNSISTQEINVDDAA